MPLKTKVATRRVIDTAALYQGIGVKMRRARESAGLSQQDVGIALGLTRAGVSNIEAGKQRVLLEHVYNTALLLGIEAKDLLP